MKEQFWSIFEIAINYYQGFIQMLFIYKFLQPSSKKKSKILLVVFSILLGSTVTALNHITIYEGIASVLYILILFSFSIVAFKDKLIKKIFASVIPFVVVLLVTTVELNLISYFCGISVKELIICQDLRRFICLLIIQISLYVLLFLISNFFDKTDEYALSDWAPIVTVLISSFILTSLLYAISLSINKSERIYINFAYLVIILLNVIMLYTIQSLVQKNREINEMKLSKLKEKHMNQFVEDANLQYDLIRKIRHDIKDRLSTVYFLISKNKIHEAMEFIAQSNNIVNEVEVFVRTNNAVVNSIINSKLSSAQTLGINVSCITIADFNGISDLDLCDLLSNTLENATTACKNMPQNSDRFIHVNIKKENNIYTFNIKNSIHKSVLGTNPLLKTTKKDKQNHGLGTEIIKDIANKYNGRYDFYEIDNTFCCSVSLIT